MIGRVLRNARGPGAEGRPPVFPAGHVGLTSREVTLADGSRLRVVEAGAVDAPTVLLIHGFGASAYQWRHLMMPLADAGWHVVAPDLPGHGFSQLLFEDGEYTRSAYARRLWMLLDALQVSRSALVGHSMGGAIAAEMAWQQPTRLTRLALISAAGFGDVPQRAYWLQIVPDALAPLAHPFAGRTTARLILRDVYGPDSSWSTRDEEELLAPYAQPGIFRAMLRTLKEFDWSLHPPEALARLPRGTLLVFGTHDKVVQPVALEQAAAAMIDGRLVTLPRVGHLPHVEAAAEVAALLRDFLEPARMAMPPGAG